MKANPVWIRKVRTCVYQQDVQRSTTRMINLGKLSEPESPKTQSSSNPTSFPVNATKTAATNQRQVHAPMELTLSRRSRSRWFHWRNTQRNSQLPSFQSPPTSTILRRLHSISWSGRMRMFSDWTRPHNRRERFICMETRSSSGVKSTSWKWLRMPLGWNLVSWITRIGLWCMCTV